MLELEKKDNSGEATGKLSSNTYEASEWRRGQPAPVCSCSAPAQRHLCLVGVLSTLQPHSAMLQLPSPCIYSAPVPQTRAWQM